MASAQAALDGNGVPGCPRCYGRGVLDIKLEGDPIPAVYACACVVRRQVLQNCERAWPTLTRAARIESTPLMDYTKKSLWVTSDLGGFKNHLRHVALRQGPNWSFRVYTDFDYMREWLRPLQRKGEDIHDADVARADWRELDSDIVEGPALLVLRLGVKAARNKAMPEVLLETLLRREHINKPTWVFDQPTDPLGPDHLCYSPEVAAYLMRWEHMQLGLGTQEAAVQRPATATATTPAIVMMPTLGTSGKRTGKARGVPSMLEDRTKKPKHGWEK